MAVSPGPNAFASHCVPPESQPIPHIVDCFVPSLDHSPSQTMFSVDSHAGFGENSVGQSCSHNSVGQGLYTEAHNAELGSLDMQSYPLHHGVECVPMQPVLEPTSVASQQTCAQVPPPEALCQVTTHPAFVSMPAECGFPSNPSEIASAVIEDQTCVPRLGIDAPCVPEQLPELHLAMTSPVSIAEGNNVIDMPSIALPKSFKEENASFEPVSADVAFQPLPEIVTGEHEATAPKQGPAASSFGANAQAVFSLPVYAQAVGASVESREDQGHFEVHRHFAEEPFLPDIDFAPKLVEDSALQCLPEAASETKSMSSTGDSAGKTEVQSLVTASSVPASSSKAVSIVRPVDDAEITLRPALVRTDTGSVLSANVCQSSQQAQWDWQRASTAIGFKTQKLGTYLRENKDYHEEAMIEAEININEIVYRGWGSEAKGEHTLGSSAYLLVIMLVCVTRQNAAAVKLNALKLTVGLVKVAVASLLSLDEVFPGLIYGTDKAYHQSSLQFGTTGIVTNLHGLMVKNSGCSWAWEQLMAKGFCGYKIASAFQHPTIWDFIIFLLWAKCHPSVRKIWAYFGQFMWPKVLHVAGKLLDKLAYMKSQQSLEELPLLRTKSGRRRIIPWINKLVLLRKMKKVRSHRKSAATSHDDLVPSNAQIVKAEEFLCASLYTKKIKETYQDCYHYSVHWDPSGYDVETLVSIVFHTKQAEMVFQVIYQSKI